MSEAAAPPKKSKLIWVVLFLVLLLFGGAGAAAYYFLVVQAPDETEEVSEEEVVPPALYFELRPAFVVNLSGPDSSRFLQVEVDLMARDQAVLNAIQAHNPAIRNALLLLFGSQRAADLQTREGKEALQRNVLDSINDILASREEGLAVEEIYFSSFVMQ